MLPTDPDDGSEKSRIPDRVVDPDAMLALLRTLPHVTLIYANGSSEKVKLLSYREGITFFSVQPFDEATGIMGKKRKLVNVNQVRAILE